MEYPIRYQGKQVGSLNIQICDIRVSFHARCSLHSLDVFRCYGRISGKEPLLLGVLEPEDNQIMTLFREFSMTQLHQQHAYPDLPVDYFLLGASDSLKDNSSSAYQEENSGERIETEQDITDPLILSCLQRGQIQRKGDEIYCPFDPGKPNPMSFLLTVCRIEEKAGALYAVYQLPGKNGR